METLPLAAESTEPGSRALPTGTVTYVFTDIEGSTRILQQLGEAFLPVLERHNAIVQGAVDGHGGTVVKIEGDGFFAVFGSAVDAILASIEIQRALATQQWPSEKALTVRIGVHTGEGRLGGSDYIGLDVHRASRIGNSGHGGQVVLSETTTRLVEYALPIGTKLEDLGSHRLRDLIHEEHLYQLTIDGLADEFPPLKTLTTSKGNLPHDPDDLVGRTEERDAVAAAIAGTRLVTLTGPGGVGKTRLALKVGSDVATEFEDGVWLVEVSRIVEEGRLASTIAQQLNITENAQESIVDTLIGRLGRAHSLLILDGCEHLIEPVAKLVDRLLQGTTELRILVTSREWLAIRGESLVQVPPLTVPGSHAELVAEIAASESVQLFVRRARLVQPRFELDAQNVRQIAEICRRLDGIPLAIELAAARLKVLSTDQLLDRLGQQFALLAGNSRDALPHQQTLETTLDWSYDFLTAEEKALFAKLSVFSGGFTFDAVEAVCADDDAHASMVLNLLERLVETSLVMSSVTEPGRYRLLEPISHYGRMKLGEGDATDVLLRRHADFYRSLAERAGENLHGREQTVWVKRLDEDRYNLRSAMRWLLGREHYEEAAIIASSMRWFWVMTREVTEGAEWLDLMLAHREALSDATLARVLNGAGLMGIRSIDFAKAGTMWRDSLAVYEKLGDERGIARQIYHLATLAWFEDKLDDASKLIAEAEEKSRAIGDTWAMAWSMAVGGTMARARGDLVAARRLLTESHEALMSVTGTLDQGWSHLRLGALARDEGDYAEATSRFSTGRDLLVYADDLTGVTHANAGLGAMGWLSGDHQYALDLYRSVVDGFSLSEDASNNLFELKTMIQSNPSTEELRTVVESNRERASRMGDAGPRTALAEYIYHVGKTAHRQGQYERSRAALVEALYLYRTAEEMPGVACSLAGLASSAHARGEMEMAARLFGLAEWYAISDDVKPWPPAEEPHYAEQIAEARADLGGEQFVKETIEGEGLTLEDAMKLAGLPDR